MHKCTQYSKAHIPHTHEIMDPSNGWVFQKFGLIEGCPGLGKTVQPSLLAAVLKYPGLYETLVGLDRYSLTIFIEQ